MKLIDSRPDPLRVSLLLKPERGREKLVTLPSLIESYGAQVVPIFRATKVRRLDTIIGDGVRVLNSNESDVREAHGFQPGGLVTGQGAL